MNPSAGMTTLLLKLYEMPRDGNFFGHVLDLLEQKISAAFSGYTFTCVDSGFAEKKLVRSLAGRPVPEMDALNRAMPAHPFVDIYCSNRTASMVCSVDIMSEEEWKSTAICRELYRLLGVIHETSVRFYSGSICISFEFFHETPLDGTSRQLLERIAPHLENAYRAHQIQKSGLLFNLNPGMVQLSADGTVIDCPSTAGQLLSRYFPGGKQVFAWNLPEEVERWIQERMRQESVGKRRLKPEKLSKRVDESVLEIDLIPHAGGIVMRLEEKKTPASFGVLLKLGLTKREAEVLMWVAQGKQNSEVGLILNISTATTRKHVEHILEKLHCETRGAAAQIAMQAFNEQMSHATPLRCFACTELDCATCVVGKRAASK